MYIWNVEDKFHSTHFQWNRRTIFYVLEIDEETHSLNIVIWENNETDETKCNDSCRQATYRNPQVSHGRETEHQNQYLK